MKQQVIEEKTGISYTLNGDYYIPDLELSEKEQQPIGKYGMLRKRFLQEQRKGIYSALMLSGKLYEHLYEVDELTREFVSRTVKQLAAAQGIDEALKARDQHQYLHHHFLHIVLLCNRFIQ